MRQSKEQIHPVDPIWESIRKEARAKIEQEPLLASFFHDSVQVHDSLEECLSLQLARKLGSAMLAEKFLYDVMIDSMRSVGGIGVLIRSDLQAFRERDPACNQYSMPLLYFKGFLTYMLSLHRRTRYINVSALIYIYGKLFATCRFEMK